MTWHTTEDVAQILNQHVDEVRLLCATGQIAWRPANPQARRIRYLISDQAIKDYERATTVAVRTRPLRRIA